MQKKSGLVFGDTTRFKFSILKPQNTTYYAEIASAGTEKFSGKRTFNLPVQMIQDAGTKRMWECIPAYICLKLSGRGVFCEEGFLPNHVMRKLVRLKWARPGTTRKGARGFYISSVERLLRGCRNKAVAQFREAWLGEDPRVPCCLIALRYLARPQSGRAQKSRLRKKLKHLPPDEHSGGVSLSLLARFFGNTPQWASQMRRLLEGALFAMFNRRAIAVDAAEVEGYDFCWEQGPYFYCKKVGRWMREVTSELLGLDVRIRWGGARRKKGCTRLRYLFKKPSILACIPTI